MKKLDRALYSVAHFLGNNPSEVVNETTRTLFNALSEQLQKDHEFSVIAQINVGRFDTVKADISEKTYFEDYEVTTYKLVDEDGNEFDTLKEAQEYYEAEFTADDLFDIKTQYTVYGDPDLTEVWDTFDEIHEALDWAVSHSNKLKEGVFISPEYIVYEKGEDDPYDDEVFKYEIDAEDHADSLVDRAIQDKIAYLEEFGDTVPDEIMWNTVWNFNNDACDEELAKRCGLAVVMMDDQTYLGLRGCGMDLSPQIVAYLALRYGCVEESDVNHFSSRSGREYFEHVVGKDLAQEVYNNLGIAEAVRKENEKELGAKAE